MLDATNSFIGAGQQNNLKGTAVYGFGYRNHVNASAGFVAGIDNILGETRQVRRTFAIGEGLQSETDYQTLLGKWNAYDTGAALIFGGGNKAKDGTITRKNIYTLRASGTPTAKTDLTTKHYVDSKFANLSGALHYIGTTTTPIAEGTVTKEIIISGALYSVNVGDVVTYDDSDYGLIEFVWNGTQWVELGAASNFVTKAVYDAKVDEFERRIKALEDMLANVGTLTITESDNTLTVQ